MVILGIIILFSAIFVYILKNIQSVKNIAQKLYNLIGDKYFQLAFKMIFVYLCICLIIYSKYSFDEITKSIKFVITAKNNEKSFFEYDIKLKEENEFYKEIIKKEYDINNSQKPYIPEGFRYLTGTVEEGFVVTDNDGNEYVWVPCSNIETDKIPKLEKINFEKPVAFISYSTCKDDEYEEFLKSALENGGFYISRYEIGTENDTPVSKNGVECITGITKDEALDIVNNMYDNINCKLMNGYAYDTTRKWIEKTNFTVEVNGLDIGNDDKVISGREVYNNIYDINDNVMEYTSEKNYESVIIRGYAFKDETKEFSRYSVLETERNFDKFSLIGFRTILYK